MPMLNYYKFATTLLAPLVPLWLHVRKLRGKEDAGRIGERFGRTSYGRPPGTLLWIHAASVGEANSVLSLIQQLKKKFPLLHILLTTGTVTSAALMKKRLPAGVIHHYAPVDTPEATERFIRHWLPDVVWFVESELWPNLIDAGRRYYCLMALINARMSERSFYFWKKYHHAAHQMLSAFYLCFAQSEQDAARLRELGASQVITSGNLKYDAPTLPCNEGALLALRQMIAGRTVWLAASTHPSEELMAARAHRDLAQIHPSLLTIIVPRHPERGGDIARELAAYGATAQRSLRQPVTENTAFYIADTLGELGLFYRLCDVVFMGGSLVAHGGQNPLEPAHLACAIISGSHTHNFQEVYQEMLAAKAVKRVDNEAQLSATTGTLLANPDLRHTMQASAKLFVEQKSGTGQMILDMFAPVLAQ